MSVNTVVTSRNLDIEKVTFGEAKRNKAGGIGVPIKYDGTPLQLRLPRLAFPGGLKTIVDEKTGKTNYSLRGALKGCDVYVKEHSTEDSDIARFYNFLLDLQEKLVKTATENSTKWFSKKRSEESVRDSLNTFVKASVDKVGDEWVPNGKYPPSITTKINVYEGRVAMDAVDSSGNQLYLTPETLLSVFHKGVEADLVVSPNTYIMSGGGFGVTWRISYARVFPRTKLTAASVFSDEPEEEIAAEEEKEEATPAQPPAEDAAPAAQPAGANRKRRVAVPPA
jgi:hypothetical protein